MSRAIETQVYSIEDIQRANEASGQHFFSPGAMSFFGSKALSDLFYGVRVIYFITSEKRPNSNDPRLYSVREFDPSTGRCETAKGTDFQEFETLGKAKRRAEWLAANGHKVQS